jgi:hypothetical protein
MTGEAGEHVAKYCERTFQKCVEDLNELNNEYAMDVINKYIILILISTL